ncbi:MAG: universal stress protein [Magnetococcales bacterium]|nr:universal stress protein [Magnetococcales bacterium]
MSDSDSTNVGIDPFKDILLASDGSEFGAGTERIGLELAQRHGARLHVFRLLTASPGTDEGLTEEQEANLQMERMTELCADRGVECIPLLRPGNGDPGLAIVAAAKEIGTQLVIMGRRGRRGLAKLMVGEATAKVIEKAECSVLVAPRLVSYWSNGVLLVLEDPPQGEGDAAAIAAFHLALHARIPLTILMMAEEQDNDAERRETNQTVNRLVAMAHLQGVACEGMVQFGDIDEIALETARQRAADLIVCEPRDRSVIEKLFNANNIIKLIGQVHCPVLVVKPVAAGAAPAVD